MPSDDLTRLPEDSNSASILSAGQTFGQYKVIRLLGRGGMGEVYEVEHPVIRKRYALKLVKHEIMSRPEAVERFQREAQVMANLEHPNVVKVDDFGETEGRTWLRMELIQGGALDEKSDWWLESGEFHSISDLLRGKPLPEDLVVNLLKEILEGLSYAHEKGVVHRDLKPSNILLQSNSLQPKISDFGLVRLAGEEWIQSQVQLTVARSMADPDATRLDEDVSGTGGTSTQAMLGTFEFMAPEQKKGKEADARSDLYAIGLIAFRMLTGEDVPGMEPASEIVPGLDPEWDAWLIKSLKQKAEARFGSAAEMLEAVPDGIAQDVEVQEQESEDSGQMVEVTCPESEDCGDEREPVVSRGGKSGHKGLFFSLVVLLLLGFYFVVHQTKQKRVANEAPLAEPARLVAEEEARVLTEQEKARQATEVERLRVEKERASELTRQAEETRLAREKAKSEELMLAESTRKSEADNSSIKSVELIREAKSASANEIPNSDPEMIEMIGYLTAQGGGVSTLKLDEAGIAEMAGGLKKCLSGELSISSLPQAEVESAFGEAQARAEAIEGGAEELPSFSEGALEKIGVTIVIQSGLQQLGFGANDADQIGKGFIDGASATELDPSYEAKMPAFQEFIQARMQIAQAEQQKAQEEAQKDAMAEFEDVAAEWKVKENFNVVLETTQGNVTIELMPSIAPLAVANFVGHIESGYYNGLTFHRIIKDFIIQGGDPLGTGTGGESIWGKNFPDEVSPEARFDTEGLLAMANSGPMTNGSQFFITTSKPEWLNDKQTIFGKVVEGYDNVKKLEGVETDAKDKPIKPQKIIKVYVKN